MAQGLNQISRRHFLAAAGAALAAPLFIPASALGRAGRPAPSERIVFGCIGLGGQGMGDMRATLGLPDCQVVAVCDVDKDHLNAAQRAVNDRYHNTGCKTYGDFRELLARKDIDAVNIVTPNHWHALLGIAAAKAGKDIYCEKPLTLTLREGRALVEAVKRYERVLQVGSQQRSGGEFRFTTELVRNGRIGKVHTIEVGIGGKGPGGRGDFTNPPPNLDYDMWLGPAPLAPYCADRIHWNWRWFNEYGGGQLMDWIGHHLDIAHMGMGWDNTGPIEVEGTGTFPTVGIWNAATNFDITATYRDGTKVNISDKNQGGTKWIGTDGWVYVNRGKKDASPKSLLGEEHLRRPIEFYRSPGHMANFVECIRSRGVPVAPAETGHRSASVGHLGTIAMMLGRKLRWNPETEQVLDDPAANAMLGRAMREPWQI